MIDSCVRRAWLTLPDGRSVELEGASWFCSSLDLGSPTVREVVASRPDADGTDDRSALLGGRVVSAAITALSTVASGRIDEIASAFAPFMHPGQRPTLHYVLDRGDNDERTLTLRAAAYNWPIAGPYQRDIQLQWVAPDPIAYGADERTATAAAGEAIQPGRTYPLTFPRAYAPDAGESPTTAQLRTSGDVAARPMLRIFGPITQPRVTVELNYAGGLDIGAAGLVPAHLPSRRRRLRRGRHRSAHGLCQRRSAAPGAALLTVDQRAVAGGAT